MKKENLQVLEEIAKIIPALTHTQKEKLLSFGEGMVYANVNTNSLPPRKYEDSSVQHNGINNSDK